MLDCLTFVFLYQEEISSRVGVNDLLDTGSLAGGFVSRRVVDKFNLQPVISETSYTVCSSLDNQCYEVNTILLLHVSFFNEIKNKCETSETEAIVLRETPFDFIIGRETIIKYNLFDKIPSQLGNKILNSVGTKKPELVERPCDCLLKDTLMWPPTGSPTAEQTETPSRKILTSLILNSENPLSGLLPDDDEVDYGKTDTFKSWLPSHSDVDVLSLIHISGDEDLQRRLRSLCREFKDIFSNELPASPAKMRNFHLEVDDEKWRVPQNRTPPRTKSTLKQAALFSTLETLLKRGLIVKSQASHYSQVLLVPKPDSTFRMCVDYSVLNDCTVMTEVLP